MTTGFLFLDVIVYVTMYLGAAFYVYKLLAGKSKDVFGDISHTLMFLAMGQMYSPASWVLLPFNILGWVFAANAAVFAYRLFAKTYVVWWWDALHLGMDMGMAYHLLGGLGDVALGAIIFAVFFAAFTIFYVVQTLSGLFAKKPAIGILGDFFHVAMGALMFWVLLQMGIGSPMGDMPAHEHHHEEMAETCPGQLPENTTASLSTMEMGDMTHVMITTNYPLGTNGKHWHLLVDGEEQGMYDETSVMLTLPSGKHIIGANLADELPDGDHCVYPLVINELEVTK